jgi:hypothetical protein
VLDYPSLQLPHYQLPATYFMCMSHSLFIAHHTTANYIFKE